MDRSDDWSSEDEPADARLTREYSDFVLYFAKSGRFQHHPLMDEARRQGVISLCGMERIHKMSQERRLKPVVMSLTPGEPPQRVYLVSIVSSSVALEELDDIVRRLNESLDGLQSVEKEDFVRQVINDTGSAIRPGVRYLPRRFYGENEERPPSGVKVDRDGHEILDTEDEVPGYVKRPSTESRRQKKPGDVTLPSTKAKLPPVVTDSESTPSKRKQDVKAPPGKAPRLERDDEDQSTQKEASIKEQAPSSSSSSVRIVDSEERDNKDQAMNDAFMEAMDEYNLKTSDTPSQVTLDAGPSTSQASGESGGRDPYLLKSEFDREMNNMKGSLENIKTLLEALARVRASGSVADFEDLKQLLGQDKSAPSVTSGETTLTLQRGPSTATGPPGKDPPVSQIEARVLNLFPINKYTRAIDWMLKQPVVRRLIYIKILSICYSDSVQFKPDNQYVVSTYMDTVATPRLQGHFGKATGGGRNLDFGRCPMPMALLAIANEDLAPLAKKPVPGSMDNAEFLKERNNTVRKKTLMKSNYISQASCQEEMAMRILFERIDFYENHMWLFPRIDPDNVGWTFEKELAKTKKSAVGKTKPSQPDFDYVNYHRPANIDEKIFGATTKAEVIDDKDVAKDLVRQLNEITLHMPNLPKSTWDLVAKEVEPTAEEIAIEEKRQKMLKKRREVYRKKQQEKALDESKSEEEDDDDEDDPEADDSGSDSDDSDLPSPPGSGTAGKLVRNPFASPTKSDKGKGKGKSSKKTTGKDKDSAKDNTSKAANVKMSTGPRRDIMKQMFGTSTESSSASNQQPIVLDQGATRQEMIGQHFGPMTSSSSSGTQNVTARTGKDGQMVFEAENGVHDDAEPEQQVNVSNDYVTVFERVADASPSGYKLVGKQVPISDLSQDQLDQLVLAHEGQGLGEQALGPPVIVQPVANRDSLPVVIQGQDLLQQAVDAGLADVTMDTTVSANMSMNKTSEYSILAVNPNDAIPRPTIVTGVKNVTQTTEETITRPGTSGINVTQQAPREKTPMQRYEDMEDDLPSLSSSSVSAKFSTDSSSTSSGKNPMKSILKHMEFPPGTTKGNTPNKDVDDGKKKKGGKSATKNKKK